MLSLDFVALWLPPFLVSIEDGRREEGKNKVMETREEREGGKEAGNQLAEEHATMPS